MNRIRSRFVFSRVYMDLCVLLINQNEVVCQNWSLLNDDVDIDLVLLCCFLKKHKKTMRME